MKSNRLANPARLDFSRSHAQRGNADRYEFPRKAWELENTVEGKNADFYLQKTKNRIEEIGQWGLIPRWEAVNTMAQIK